MKYVMARELELEEYRESANRMLAKGLMAISAYPLKTSLFGKKEEEILGIVLACLYLGMTVHSAVVGTTALVSNSKAHDVGEVLYASWAQDPAIGFWTFTNNQLIPLAERQPEWPFAEMPRVNASPGTLEN